MVALNVTGRVRDVDGHRDQPGPLGALKDLRLRHQSRHDVRQQRGGGVLVGPGRGRQHAHAQALRHLARGEDARALSLGVAALQAVDVAACGEGALGVETRVAPETSVGAMGRVAVQEEEVVFKDFGITQLLFFFLQFT